MIERPTVIRCALSIERAVLCSREFNGRLEIGPSLPSDEVYLVLEDPSGIARFLEATDPSKTPVGERQPIAIEVEF